MRVLVPSSVVESALPPEEILLVPLDWGQMRILTELDRAAANRREDDPVKKQNARAIQEGRTEARQHQGNQGNPEGKHRPGPQTEEAHHPRASTIRGCATHRVSAGESRRNKSSPQMANRSLVQPLLRPHFANGPVRTARQQTLLLRHPRALLPHLRKRFAGPTSQVKSSLPKINFNSIHSKPDAVSG